VVAGSRGERFDRRRTQSFVKDVVVVVVVLLGSVKPGFPSTTAAVTRFSPTFSVESLPQRAYRCFELVDFCGTIVVASPPPAVAVDLVDEGSGTRNGTGRVVVPVSDAGFPSTTAAVTRFSPTFSVESLPQRAYRCSRIGSFLRYNRRRISSSCGCGRLG
jgi:hypothetical protein